MVGLDADLDVLAGHRRQVGFVPTKNRDLPPLQLPRLSVLFETDRAECDEHALAARRRRRRGARRAVSYDSDILVLERRRGCGACRL